MNADRQKPLVSVIVCAYNAGAYLRPSLLSVLSQTHRELEVLVVDDGSADGCMETIADLTDSRIRIFRQENKGKPSALNMALQHASGEFYAVQDADDLSYPQRIEAQVACMQENPDVAAVYCGHDLIISERRVAPLARFKDRGQCRRDISQFLMPAHDPTGMYRVSMVSDMRYEFSLPIVEGYDYVLRLGERRPMLVLGQCLYGYRIHRNSVTRRNPQKRDCLVREVLLRACHRRLVDPAAAFPHVFGQNAWEPTSDDNNIAAHFMASVCDLRARRCRWAAIATGLNCIGLRPRSLHYWKAFVYSVLPLRVVEMIRGANHRSSAMPEFDQPLAQET